MILGPPLRFSRIFISLLIFFFLTGCEIITELMLCLKDKTNTKSESMGINEVLASAWSIHEYLTLEGGSRK